VGRDKPYRRRPTRWCHSPDGCRRHGEVGHGPDGGGGSGPSALRRPGDHGKVGMRAWRRSEQRIPIGERHGTAAGALLAAET
jgi:hypothetical protein